MPVRIRSLMLAIVTGALCSCVASTPGPSPTPTLGPLKFSVRLDPASRKAIPPMPIWMLDPRQPDAGCPSPPMCAAWKAFRIVHSEPYQAMSVATDGEQSVIILSEPPPSVDRMTLTALLRSLFGTDLLDLREFRWPIGIDGWLGDVVLRVRSGDGSMARVYSGDTMAGWSAPAAVVDRLHLLYRFFYQTNDGFWIDNLNTGGVPQTVVPDLTVSAADLNGWTRNDASPWIPLKDSNRHVPWKDIKTSSTPVTYRHGNELIALVIPSAERLSDTQGAFREFAVASDLLVGAMKTENGNVVILGRARTVPLAVLPPLRFETFENYANHRAAELDQSYERNAIFAGRVTRGPYESWDWAPILLSAQLDDTEAGAVLNLADQVLKSWSEHGNIDYYAFRHKRPTTYPFGDIRASDYFETTFFTSSLRYNWNTETFSSTVDLPDRNILAPNRTNALPVLYDPSGNLSELLAADAKGYKSRLTQAASRKALEARDYFARLGDPLLVRDVQNVILYQITQHYLSTPDTQMTVGRSERDSELIQSEAQRLLEQVLSSRSRSDASLKRNIRSIMKNSGLDDRQFAEFIVAPQHLLTEKEHNAAKAYDDAFKAACDQTDGEVLGDRCQYSGTMSAEAQDGFSRATADAKRAFQQIAALDPGALRSITDHLSDLKDNAPILKRVLAQSARMSTVGFVRTPSVVLSRDVKNVESVGGHNIYAATNELSAAAVELKSALPIARVLETQHTGTLLEEMRALPAPLDMKIALSRAQECDCDALVTRDPSGEITIVRNAPPPVVRVISGKTGLLDALAPPPSLAVVRFDNFDPQLVHDILATKALMEAPEQGPSVLGGLRKLFSTDHGKPQTRIDVLANADPRDGGVELIGNPNIQPRFTWSGEPSELVGAKDFNRLFGLPTDSGQSEFTTRVVVRFNSVSKGSNRADVLGVRAKGIDPANVGTVKRFKAIVDAWLGRQPQNVHVLTAANDLFRTLHTSMPGIQQELYLGRNARSLRIADRTNHRTASWIIAAL